MNNDQIQTAFKYLYTDDHIKLVYGVLKKLNVQPSQDYYADLVNEGQLAFVRAYCQYEDMLDHDQYGFHGRIFLFVKHRIIDYLRRQTRQSSYAEFSLDNESMTEETRTAKLGSSLINQDCSDQLIQMETFHQLYDLSPVVERRYLLEHLILHRSLREIAAKYHVSPAAVSKWKKRSIERARKLRAQQ
jgi:RNA polymerase sigma factor (sigma-70 family)